MAVVVPCHQQAHFLAGAIESALEQSIVPSEIIVVDDGSRDDIASVVGAFPQVTFVSQPNRGLAAARNAGLAVASADKVIFLDADDRLLPGAVFAGLRAHENCPNAAFVYGGYRLVERKREVDRLRAVDSRCDLIRCNWIGMIGSVMFDRLKLLETGAFDESLGMCEDWDVYLRATRKYPFTCHGEIVARYVRHGSNMSNDRTRLKKWIEIVRRKELERGLTAQEEEAWREGRDVVRTAYAGPLTRAAARLSRWVTSR